MEEPRGRSEKYWNIIKMKWVQIYSMKPQRGNPYWQGVTFESVKEPVSSSQ